ncbi:MAG TPA: AAA family ATPase [Solirubrobacterales bacterium]|nr:AAA family ATPase [Solirubrobacterales bacterium]
MGDAERKLATIVFADLVGSTKLVAGRDPEDVRGTLQPFIALARRTFEEHGGVVEKYIGDAVMAVFGAPQAHGDDPDRAVAAALALVERLSSEEERLELRIGIEAGEVLVAPRDGDLSVTGEPTHAAARLQQAAEPGEILVGPRAAQAVRTAELADRREVDAAGFPEPIPAWRASGSGDGGPAAVAMRPADEVALLGRGAELETLRLAYMRTVRERRPHLVLLVGEAGAGKTRLVRELIANVRSTEPEALVLTGRNPPYGDGIAFWALAELLRAAAGVPRVCGAAEVRAALGAKLDEVGEAEPDETAATLAGTLDGGDATTNAAAIRRAWRRLIACLADQRPVLIAIDDAHWADEGFLDMVEDIADLPAQPVLVVCTARPEIDERRPGLGEGERRQRLPLGPLSQVAAEELAAALVAGDDLELAREIAATSGGNPFFTEEIARTIRAEDPSAHTLPDNVQTAIASRLDALPAEEKRAVQYASVLGDRFRPSALAKLLGRDPAQELASLEARALVESRAADELDLYAFHHQLIRDVAYASLTKAERVDLHERAAADLAEAAGARYAEIAEVIAFHLTRAAELDPQPERQRAAFDATTDASAHAARRGAVQRAQHLLEDAAELAPDVDHRIRVLEEAAQLALARLRGDEGYELKVAAARAAEGAGKAYEAACMYAAAVETASRMGGISGRFREADLVETLERAERLAPDPEPSLKAQLVLDHAWISWSNGRPEEIGEPAAEALALAREVGDPLLLSSALDAAASTTWWQGRFRDSAAMNRERIDVLERVPPSPGVAAERTDALWMLTQSLIRSGELREALRWDAINASEIAQSAPHIASAHSIPALYLVGEWDEVLERGIQMRTHWHAEGRPPFAPFSPSIATVAAVHGLRGDEPSYRDWMELAERVAGDTQQVAGVQMMAAEVALHFGDVDRAVQLFADIPPTFWWRDNFIARRAEALARAGHPSARAELEAADALQTDDPMAAAVRLRAHAALSGDDEPLRQALATFDRLECVFAAAHTRWLLGGDERDRAAEAFRRLGVVLPA